MVTFELIFQSEEYLRYAYYPEGKREGGGIIELDIAAGIIKVVVPAKHARLRRASAEDFASMREAINSMRREAGKKELDEEELPAEVCEWYVYADHAMSRLLKEYNRGTVLEKGSSAWY